MSNVFVIEINSPGSGVIDLPAPAPVTVEVVQVAAPDVIALGLQGPKGADGTTIFVGPSPPPSPAVGALWVDSS